MERTSSFERAASRVRSAATTRRLSQPNACAIATLEIVPAVMDTLRAAMRRHVGEQSSVPQFRCLNFISREPGCSIGAVGSFLGVTMPTASAMVDRLVRAGAVKARGYPGDRRRTQLHITATGQAQLKVIRDGAHDDLVAAFANLSATELRELEAGLDVLRRAFPPT